MQRGTKVRIVTILALVVLAAAIARLTTPSAVGFGGSRAVQRSFAAATITARAWLGALTSVFRDPGRVAGLEQELAGLRAERAALQRALLRQEGDAAERAQVYPKYFGAPIVAEVVAAAFEPTSQTIVVAHSPATAIHARDPVVGHGALIGIVAVPGSSRTIVRLLTDSQSRIGVELAGEPDTLGVLEADSGGGLAVTHIPNNRTIAIGDAVVSGAITSGLPRGIPIGTVAAVRTDPDGFFQAAAVDPFADPRRELAVTIFPQASEK